MARIFLFLFLMSENVASETIISLKYELSKSEKNRVVSVARKDGGELLPIHSVSAFRYTKPKLATVLFGPYEIKEHKFSVKAVDCRKKYGLFWRCKSGTEYKFMYFDEIHKAIQIDDNIGYALAKKVLDFSKTTDCYPRYWPSNIEVDREGLQFSESLKKTMLSDEYIILASGCAMTVRVKSDVISVVNISYAF